MRRPLLRFFALGALLFAAETGWRLAAAPRANLAPPSTGPLTDDEILFREALARGEHRSDSIVRRRLAQNLRFALAANDKSEAELVDEAIALGMHESDLVVRRRLAQRSALRIQEPARAEEPSEAELAAYLAANAPRWTEPARVRAVQIFFRDAKRAAAARSSLAARPEAASGHGDALPFPAQLPSSSQEELARQFGVRFAAEVFDAEPARWVGPIASAYGHHLVFVTERSPARVSPLAAVRSELREALLAARAEALLAGELTKLRARLVGGRTS